MDSLLLNNNHLRMVYKRRNAHIKIIDNTIYTTWLDRSRLINIINFLIRLDNTVTYLVVYNNCAPANEVKMLSLMFPNFVFYLFDDGLFTHILSKIPNVFIYNKKLTSDIGKQINSVYDSIVYISNKAEELDELPIIAQLYYIPIDFDFEETEQVYYDGDLYKQIYTSKQLPLLYVCTSGKNKKTYDVVKYQDMLYYHNRYIRVKKQSSKFEPIYNKLKHKRNMSILAKENYNTLTNRYEVEIEGNIIKSYLDYIGKKHIHITSIMNDITTSLLKN